MNLKRACTSNKSDSSFPSKIPVLSQPVTGSGIIDVIGDNDALDLFPYGTGADNTTYSMRVIGWSLLELTPSATTPLWIPQIIAELLCTNSAAVGVTLSPLTSSERFADTITLGAGGIAVLYSPANDTPAMATVSITGFRKVEFTFDMTGATDANVLYRQYKELI